MADDYGSSTSNYGTLNTANLSVGGTVSISGTIETNSDQDWFKVSLNAGYTYKITAINKGVGDPHLSLFNSSGSLIKNSGPNDDSASDGNVSFSFSPTSTGTYYLGVQDNGNNGDGGYQISVKLQSVHDAPAGTDKTLTFNEDANCALKVADFGFTDPNDTPANNFTAVKIATLPSAGTLKLNGTAVTSGQSVKVSDITAGKLLFTPVANANGANYANFTFQVQDDGSTANGGVNLDATPNRLTFNVSAVNDAPSGKVTISGINLVGQTLTATSTLADSDGLGTLTYTWKTGTTVLGTGKTYLLKGSEIGKTLTVTASYTDGGGTAEKVTSAATAAVTFNKTALVVDGTTLYLANGSSGIAIQDASNPNHPLALGAYDTAGNAHEVAVATISAAGNTHQVAAIADDSRGLQVLEVSDPAAPTALATVTTSGAAQGVVISPDSYAYVALGSNGIQIIDLFDPHAPVAAATLDTPGNALEVAVAGSTLYVADGASGVQVIDVTYPDLPKLLGSYDTTGSALGIALSGQYVYVADGVKGVQILDVSTPASPRLVGTYDTPGIALDLVVAGTTAYVADGAKGVQVLDVSNPAVPVLVKNLKPSFAATNIAVSGNYALVQNDGTLQALRLVANVAPTGAVTISGSAKQGQTLTASNTLNDADGLGAITYTWKAGATVLGTGASYTLKPADAGKTVTVTASYTDGGYSDESVTSKGVGPIIGNEHPSGAVTISGKPIQGQILTASHNLSDPDVIKPETFVYTWKAGATVLGTGETYQLRGADAGKILTVIASYTDQGGSTESVVSSATAAIGGNVAPTGTVTIVGTLAVGQTLTAQNTLVDENNIPGTITYTWKARTVAVGSGATYTLTAADVGRTLFVTASYVDGGGVTEEVRSAVTGVVPNGPANHPAQGVVTINDMTPAVGQTLTASDNLTDADGKGTITYTWKTGATVLATGTIYSVTGAELGKTLTVTASYTDQLGHAESMTSAATSAVTPQPPPAGVTITPENAITSEVRGSSNAQFAVVLDSQPRENVTITFMSSNEAEGKISGNNVLTFTNGNWNIAQTLIVQGVDDAPNDIYEKSGTAYQVNGKLSSTDIDYIRGITVPVLTLVNADDPKDAPKVESGDQNPSNLRDFLVGGNCNDILSGIEDIDFIYGGRGDDRLSGGSDDDRLYGEEGNDRLNGDNGFDSLDGGLGNDTLNGGNEDDTLIGGNGKDTLIGDPGADIFVYNAATDSEIGNTARDVIQDFSSAQGDKIDLHLIGAKTFITGAFTGVAGQVRFDSVNHLLQFDLNGDKTTDGEIELIGVTALNAADLIFS